MKYRTRKYPIFAACGLNCGLCPNFHIHTNGSFKCPGCAGEGFSEAHPSCGILSCCQHQSIEFCFLCDEFPCERYTGENDADSFISHINKFSDIEKATRIGIDAYVDEQCKKVDILSVLLKDYNDGRRKTFFCQAVNLLELQDIKTVVDQIERDIKPEAPLAKVVTVVRLFEEMAKQRDISLKLRKKPKK